MCYDGYIMMARTQITLDPHLHKRARQRAAELGISLAEYLRRLVSQDLGAAPKSTDVSAVFNLGSSAGGDVAKDKDRMLGEAVALNSGENQVSS
jgi:hypothetical protein